MKSPTSIGYLSISTGSSVINHRFFPDIGREPSATGKLPSVLKESTEYTLA